ncbi:MAG TPA: methionyl aminopeptidase [Geoalkalibacter subterraneus]|uniref:Methionyl aminopeptidase n=1 Tax=Geoalkalibacter subterraneus TaxID=483547 RepID=A0A831LRE3_9BACT|nr:methionyl aminopeptidase [Geoalkalibacter subterraneus]
MPNSTDFTAPPEGPVDLERLLPQAVARILEDEDSAGFRGWLADHLPDFALGEMKSAPDELFRAMAIPLSYMIWNATPLPGNKFRPRPLPRPNRNDPCPCGSGRKYKKCCSNAPPFPALDTLVMWPLVLSNLTPDQIERAAGQGHLPLEALITAAVENLGNDRPLAAVEMLRPHFQKPVKKPGPMDDFALQTLCDAYDELDQVDEKLKLLERISQEPTKSPLRAGAWQRLTAISIDNGDLKGARQALANALRDDPGTPPCAILEMQLLAMEDHFDQISTRADFWLRKLQRSQSPPETREHITKILEELVENPQYALALTGEHQGFEDDDLDDEEELDENSLRLLDWIDGAIERPLPSYSTDEKVLDLDDQGEVDGYLRESGLSSKELAKAVKQFEEQRAEDPGREGSEKSQPESSYVLQPSPEIEKLEEQWHALCQLDKPFGIQDFPDQHWEGWEPGQAEQWIGFLEQHPEAADSFDILDDLVTALFLYPDMSQPVLSREGIVPLLRRAVSIIEKNLAGTKKPRLLWNRLSNRPALRNLNRLYAVTRYGFEDLQEADRLAEFVFEINPHDNHGLRRQHINDLLRRGENGRALAITELFPDDVFAETIYGRLLALYRLGRLRSAQPLAEEAIDAYPLVARYLTRARIKKPQVSESGIHIGGEDQAWLYREEMREAWQQAPGALDWLKKIMKIKGIRLQG